jgi:anti-sigma B factor antagonist
VKKPEHRLLQNLISNALASDLPTTEVAAMNELVQFNVSSSMIGRDALGLSIDGELDLYTAPEVHEELASIPPDVRYVIADLTGLSFLDSAGMATLLATARRLAERRGTMTLVVGDESVLRVLRVTGLDRYFEIRDDYETAAREFVELALY